MVSKRLTLEISQHEDIFHERRIDQGSAKTMDRAGPRAAGHSAARRGGRGAPRSDARRVRGAGSALPPGRAAGRRAAKEGAGVERRNDLAREPADGTRV